MAYRTLRACGIFGRSVNNVSVTNSGLLYYPKDSTLGFLKAHVPVANTVRGSLTFFTKLPAEHLWKAVTTVSNAGKKRGRGRTIKPAKNLNKGQAIGVGKTNMAWPGLTTAIMHGKELVQQHKLPEDPNREANLIKIRDMSSNFRRLKLTPLERGWSGTKWGGRSLGPPDAIGDDTFEGFETKVIEFKTICCMTGNVGAVKRFSAYVVTGNGNGLVGFGRSKAIELKSTLTGAKNRAGQRLMHVDICDGHTVFHDFICQFGKTRLIVSKKPKGYGLICHRVVKCCCEVIGIKDLHAKLHGPSNPHHIMKAFLIGLLQQKSYQQLADEKRLHLVELKKENDYFPRVIASPAVVRKIEEIKSDEIIDFKQYVLKGRVVERSKRYPPFYVHQKSWLIRMRKLEYLRNQDQVRLRLKAQTGIIGSFYTEKYPEAKAQFPLRKKEEEVVDEY